MLIFYKYYHVIMGSLLPYAGNNIHDNFTLLAMIDYVLVCQKIGGPEAGKVKVFVNLREKGLQKVLKKELQDIFEELNEEFVIKYGQIFADASREGLQFARDEHGIEVIELSGEEEDRWIERLDMVVDDWIEEKKARGLPAEEAVSITRELDEKFSSEYGDY